MATIMVFGVFDGIHEGHRSFLREAKHYGNRLIAVVAQDHIVQNLKGYAPRAHATERISALKKEVGVDVVTLGDDDLGSWEIIKKYRPDIIALGYDQDTLRKNLEGSLKKFDWNPMVIIVSAYEPDIYHSRFLRPHG